VPVQAGDLVIHVPAGWSRPEALEGGVYAVGEPDELMRVELVHRRGGDPGRELALWVAEHGPGIKDGLRSAESSGDDAGKLIDTDVAPLIALPAGWDGRELIVVAPDDGAGNHQRGRLVVCGRAAPGGAVLVAILVPETIAAAAPGFVAQLLASIEA
jgi:hypothetical protein